MSKSLRLVSAFFVIMLVVLPLFGGRADEQDLLADRNTTGSLVDVLEPWLRPFYDGEQIDFNRTEKLRLETCVSEMGFVDSSTISPADTGNLVEIEIVNRSTSPITGLIVSASDPRSVELGLDGRATIRFDPVQPGDRTVFSHTLTGFEDAFPNPSEVEVSVWDIVLDVEDGVPIIQHIFWSRWPEVYSTELYDAAVAEFCSEPG